MATKVSMVNAWGDDEEVVIVAMRPVDDDWKQFQLSTKDATQLADQLRLITKTSD